MAGLNIVCDRGASYRWQTRNITAARRIVVPGKFVSGKLLLMVLVHNVGVNCDGGSLLGSNRGMRKAVKGNCFRDSKPKLAVPRVLHRRGIRCAAGWTTHLSRNYGDSQTRSYFRGRCSLY